MKPATYYTDGKNLVYVCYVDESDAWIENCRERDPEPKQIKLELAEQMNFKEVKFCASSS